VCGDVGPKALALLQGKRKPRVLVQSDRQLIAAPSSPFGSSLFIAASAWSNELRSLQLAQLALPL
jgi:hypothetical protein